MYPFGCLFDLRIAFGHGSHVDPHMEGCYQLQEICGDLHRNVPTLPHTLYHQPSLTEGVAFTSMNTLSRMWKGYITVKSQRFVFSPTQPKSPTSCPVDGFFR
jgi:hypothetical protein